MSDTPRTNEVDHKCYQGPMEHLGAMRTNARQLERENQALRVALASYMSLCGNTGYSTSRESFQMLYKQGEEALKKAAK